MEEYYHVTINDGAPLSTDEDMRENAKKLGISYEDYISALDKHLPFDELLAYIETIRSHQN